MTPSRFRAFLAEETRATGLPIGTLIAVAATLHVVVTLLAANPWHPDEHFQILEFAWARAGFSSVDGLPWEFAARIRPALQPTLALGLLEAMHAVGVASPFAWVLTLRLGTLALSLGVLVFVCARVSPRLTRAGRQALWLTALFLWFLPLFLSRFTSENLAGMAFVVALLLAQDEGRRRGDVPIAALLGLSFVLRFQMAFAIAALLVWMGVMGRGGWARAARVALGAAVVVAAAASIDRWFYQAWVFTPWRYFQVNVVEGMAASFGTSPWYAYLVWAPLWMAPPLGLAVVALIAIGVVARPRSPWSWTFVAFVLGHSMIAHKELRFLLPLLYVVPVLVALGWESVAVRWAAWPTGRLFLGALVVQNIICAAVLATPAVHRGKDFDAHYLRFLWNTAQAHPGDTIYILTADRSAYLVRDLEASVFRHPRVREVPYAPGSPIPSAVPPGTPLEDVLVLTRDARPPSIAGVNGVDLVYQAEPGYRRMAAWIGAQDGALEHWLEKVDLWTDSQWVRRVYRIQR